MTSHSIGSLETWEPEDKSFSKHTLKAGQGELLPNEGSICSVHLQFVGDFELGDEATGEYKPGETTDVTIGEGDCALAELFDKVVCSMKEGEKCYIKSKVDAKGEKMSELEQSKALKFNMTLYSCNRSANPLELEQDERLDRAQHYKDKGTELYQKNNLEYSIKRFGVSLYYLRYMDDGELPEDLKKAFLKLRCQCLLNLGACYMKTGDDGAVIENCTAALKLEADNVKGLFRRGQTYLKLHEYDLAFADLSRAKELEPDNKAVANQMKNVETQMKKEKKMYQRMFNA